MRCLGSNQHLKGRFGEGYRLELKLQRPTAAAIDAFRGGNTDAVSRVQLSHICAECGDARRAAWVAADDERGWAVHEAFEKAGGGMLPAAILANWWLQEDSVCQLEHYIAKALPMARRVERQNFRLTYAIAGSAARAPEIFRAAEEARGEC